MSWSLLSIVSIHIGCPHIRTADAAVQWVSLQVTLRDSRVYSYAYVHVKTAFEKDS